MIKSAAAICLTGLVCVSIFGIVLPWEKKSSYLATTTYTSQDNLEASMKRGAEIYSDYCIQCHLGQGEGVKDTFPPLAQSDWLTSERTIEVIKVIKYGQSGPIKVNGIDYDGIMANLGLYDDEVADVMNYIQNNWGNTQKKMVTEKMVEAVKEE